MFEAKPFQRSNMDPSSKWYNSREVSSEWGGFEARHKMVREIITVSAILNDYKDIFTQDQQV